MVAEAVDAIDRQVNASTDAAATRLRKWVTSLEVV
jgi:hypothetical protein